MRMARPIVFADSEIADVLDQMSSKLKMTISADIIRPISAAVKRLEEVYASLLLLPEVPRVTMRTDTLQTLLGHFEAKMNDKYPGVLKDAGRSIGRSFAEDFIGTLHKIERIPRDLRALLIFWLEIESRAQWGTFNITKQTQNEVSIEVVDFFLTRGLSGRIHRNCSFMEGYIESFLWESTKTCSRWYRDEYDTPVTEKFPEPTSVIDKPFGEKCIFQISMKNEELTEAFDELYQAKKSYLTGDYRQVALSLRTALEMAFKSKIGMDVSKQVSVTSIIRSFRELNLLPSTSHNTIKDLYGRSSAIIHRSIPATKESSRVLICDGEDVLRVLELITLGEEIKMEIQGSINKT